MDTEARLLRALEVDPHNDATRQVYADWLEERGDGRAELLRLQVAPKSLPLGTPENALAQQRLRQLRRGCVEAWLEGVEPLLLLGELSRRARRCLRRLHATTLGALHERFPDDVIEATWSETTLNEFVRKLAALGLSLKDGPGPAR